MSRVEDYEWVSICIRMDFEKCQFLYVLRIWNGQRHKEFEYPKLPQLVENLDAILEANAQWLDKFAHKEPECEAGSS